MGKQKRSSSIITLLVGLALGTLVGMLFSPTGGATIRGFLVYQCRKVLQNIKSIFTHILPLHDNMAIDNTAKAASQEVIERTVRKAKKILEAAELLSNQLDGK
jgi:gas vesicle protein